MVAIGSTWLSDLIHKYLPPLRPSASLDLMVAIGARLPIAALFGPADRFATRDVDAEWLTRRELRSARDVAEFCEAAAIGADPPGSLHAVFVDHRCGLIGAHRIGRLCAMPPIEAARRILRRGSSIQASGIILATVDPSGSLIRSRACRQLVGELQRKGEAIDLYLLNLLCLSATGWSRMFPAGQPEFP